MSIHADKWPDHAGLRADHAAKTGDRAAITADRRAGRFFLVEGPGSWGDATDKGEDASALSVGVDAAGSRDSLKPLFPKLNRSE